MKSIIFYTFLVILIIWAITQPWKKSWPQFFIFCLAGILIPAYLITEGNDPHLKKIISFMAVSVLVFGAFLNLRYSEKSFLRVLDTGGAISIEEKSKYQKLSKILFIIFYFFCAIYLLLYGF